MALFQHIAKVCSLFSLVEKDPLTRVCQGVMFWWRCKVQGSRFLVGGGEFFILHSSFFILNWGSGGEVPCWIYALSGNIPNG